jgi:hypothetical protein
MMPVGIQPAAPPSFPRKRGPTSKQAKRIVLEMDFRFRGNDDKASKCS